MDRLLAQQRAPGQTALTLLGRLHDVAEAEHKRQDADWPHDPNGVGRYVTGQILRTIRLALGKVEQPEEQTMNDLVKINDWMAAHGDQAGEALVAGLRLAKGLNASHPDKLPATILTGIPDADLALAQAAGVGDIAGDSGVSVEDVIEVAGLLLSIGLTFVV